MGSELSTTTTGGESVPDVDPLTGKPIGKGKDVVINVNDEEAKQKAEADNDSGSSDDSSGSGSDSDGSDSSSGDGSTDENEAAPADAKETQEKIREDEADDNGDASDDSGGSLVINENAETNNEQQYDTQTAQERQAAEAEEEKKRQEAMATDTTRIYSEELDQSDDFTILLANEGAGKPVPKDLDFITLNPEVLDRYVRQQMYILLKYVSSLGAMRVGKRLQRQKITMSDISLYVRLIPEEIRQQFRVRVERILNSNGLSLNLHRREKLDPEQVALMFEPIFKPTFRRCDCKGACEVRHDPNPGSDNFCPCYSPEMRACQPDCKCALDCKLRNFKAEEQQEEEAENREKSSSEEDEDSDE